MTFAVLKQFSGYGKLTQHISDSSSLTTMCIYYRKQSLGSHLPKSNNNNDGCLQNILYFGRDAVSLKYHSVAIGEER